MRAARRLGAAGSHASAQMTRVPLGVSGENVMLAAVQLSAGSSRAAWPTVGTPALRASSIGSASSRASCRPAAPTSCRSSTAGATRSAQPISRPAGPEDRPQAQHHSVSEGYFETMGAALVDGRFFTAQDTADTRAGGRRQRDVGPAVFRGPVGGRPEFVSMAGAGRPTGAQHDMEGDSGRTARRHRGCGSSASSPTSRTSRWACRRAGDLRDHAAVPVQPASPSPSRRVTARRRCRRCATRSRPCRRRRRSAPWRAWHGPMRYAAPPNRAC